MKLAYDISESSTSHEDLAESLRHLAEVFRQAKGSLDVNSQRQLRRSQLEPPDYYNNRDLMQRILEGNMFDQGLKYNPYEDYHIDRIGLDPIRDKRIYGL